MLPIRRILFPVEESPVCRAFTPQVVLLARRLNAEVIALHVVPGSLEARSGEALLDSWDWGGLEVRRRVVTGNVEAGIFRTVADEHVSLVMIPARARSFWRRWTTPSLLAKVARDCEVPVWAAWGGRMPEHPEIQRVGVGLDLHGLSRRLLLDAAEFAARLGAGLEILHAVPRVDLDTLSASSIDDLPVALSRESAYLALERLKRRSGVDAPVSVETGDPAEVLPALARRREIDVLVLGAGRRTLGPNVLTTVRAARCPVLLLPRLEPREAAVEPETVGLADVRT
jgi:nucleotide-binding universal stress UspA family protein